MANTKRLEELGARLEKVRVSTTMVAGELQKLLGERRDPTSAWDVEALGDWADDLQKAATILEELQSELILTAEAGDGDDEEPQLATDLHDDPPSPAGSETFGGWTYPEDEES